jgi:ectoine hydroxylase
MIMTDGEIERFNRDGFLIYPDLVSEQEVEELRGELHRLAQQGPQRHDKPTRDVPTSEATGALRTIYAMHEKDGSRSSAPFRALSRSPRLLGRARRLLGNDELYMFQSKANLKGALDGTVFHWHQDSGIWAADGLPSGNVVTFLVMLEEATEFSGCLYFIPGSHRLGVLEQTSVPIGVPRIRLPKTRMTELLRDLPSPVPIVGKPGTGVVFHASMVHASGHNLSAKDRWHVYFVYNPIANKPRQIEEPRPDWAVSRNYEKLVPEPEAGTRSAVLT